MTTRTLPKAGRGPWLALPAVAATALVAVMAAFPVPAGADVTAVTGSAYGYQLHVTLFGGPDNPRGPAPTVTLAANASNSPQTAAIAKTDVTVGPAQFFSSDRLDVSTKATTGPTGSVTSTVNIANVDRGGSESFGYGPRDNTDASNTTNYPKNVNGLTTNISSTCTASATGVSGSTTITNGQLELDNGNDPLGKGTYAGDPKAHPPVRVTVPDHPAPNTAFEGHIEVNGQQDHWKFVFNEQVKNPDGSLTVYAAHEYLIGPTAVGNLFFGMVQCGVTAVASRTTTTGAPATTAASTTTSSSVPASTTTSSSAPPVVSTNPPPTVVLASKSGKGASPLLLGGLALLAAAAAGLTIRQVVSKRRQPPNVGP